MRSCKEVSFLLSQSLDRRLPWYTKLSLHMHLLMCSFCRVARRQALAMGQIVRAYGRETASGQNDDQPGLPPEVRERMQQSLREASEKEQTAGAHDHDGA